MPIHPGHTASYVYAVVLVSRLHSAFLKWTLERAIIDYSCQTFWADGMECSWRCSQSGPSFSSNSEPLRFASLEEINSWLSSFLRTCKDNQYFYIEEKRSSKGIALNSIEIETAFALGIFKNEAICCKNPEGTKDVRMTQFTTSPDAKFHPHPLLRKVLSEYR